MRFSQMRCKGTYKKRNNQLVIASYEQNSTKEDELSNNILQFLFFDAF